MDSCVLRVLAGMCFFIQNIQSSIELFFKTTDQQMNN